MANTAKNTTADTHYLPAFTTSGRFRTQQAACGRFISPRAHSVEPSCEVCREFLAACEANAALLQAEEAEAIARAADEISVCVACRQRVESVVGFCKDGPICSAACWAHWTARARRSA